MATNANPTKVTTGTVRLSYCHITTPYQRPGSTEAPRYSVTLLIPKADTVTKAAIDAAVEAAAQAGTTKTWGGQRPPRPAVPIHDGDGTRPSDGAQFGDECRGCWVMTASSKEPPGIVDTQLQPIIDPLQIYSGMYARVSINFFAYSNQGKKGIGCGLNNVQKVSDGEPLSATRSTPEDDFTPLGAPAQPQYGQTPPAYTPPAQPAYGQQAPAYTAPVYAPQYGTGGIGIGATGGIGIGATGGMGIGPSYAPPIDPLTGQPIPQ